MIEQVTAFSYGACAAAFLIAAGMLSISRSQNRYRAVLLVANLVTALWALLVFARVVAPSIDDVSRLLIDLLEHLRTIAWMVVIGFILYFAYKRRFDSAVSWIFAFLAGGSAVTLIGADIYLLFVGQFTDVLWLRANLIARVLMSVSGLLLVENLFRNSGTEVRWVVKNLCFALGVMFGYDFILYAEAFLFGRVDEQLFSARGLVNAIVAPLIVVASARAKTWPVDLHISRRLVFHSATLLGAGGYLIAMAAVSYYLSDFDNPWGFLLQTAFLLVAALSLIMMLASASVRAHIKGFINRNFFSYKYDYRDEWAKFITSISDRTGSIPIMERVVRALAQIVEGTSGAVWVYEEEDDAYHAAAAWNMGEVLPGISARDELAAVMRTHGGVFDLKEKKIDGIETVDVAIPEWLANHRKAWLLVPLIHVTGMPGFVVLGQSRGPRTLTWEDFDLLRTAASQAASYIAEELSLRHLARARRFEDFNRQFAFVIHDIKNLAGQMTLILKNAERHGDNPEFQKDVMETIRNSVGRMHQMLEQLRATRRKNTDSATDLCALVSDLTRGWRLRTDRIRIDLPPEPLFVAGNREPLEAIATHLVGNAIDATAESGEVHVVLAEQGPPPHRQCVLTVKDSGPGMDPKFIEEKLFQPLDTTKATGFGIGAYQVRNLARELGGRLEVESTVGQGTTFRVFLPCSNDRGAGEPVVSEETHG
ncbi:MAG: PEP-CTERM system histidine kinase PrsK [Rhodobacteraceae bacterium]|nr:PEP-CTERM system histidine kinase PrsK [Paracoccaceae bacterium]